MGTVKFELSAGEARAVQAFMKVVDVQKRAEDGSRKMGKGVKDAGNDFSQFGQEAAQSIKSVALQFASVGAAIAAAQKAYRLYVDEMKATAADTKKHALSFVDIVAGAGDTSRIGDIRKFLRDLPSQVSEKQKYETYGAVRGAMPTAELGDILALTAESVKGRAAGIQDTAAFGETMGLMRKLFPGKTINDVGDITKAVSEMGGKYGKRFEKQGVRGVQQWQAMGLGTAEEGLGWALASFTQDQGGEALNALIQKLSDTTTKPPTAGFGKQLGAVDEKRRQFYQADPKTRMRMLQSDQSMVNAVFGTQAPTVTTLLQRGSADITQQIIDAQKNDLLESSAKLVAADQESRTALRSAALEDLPKAVKRRGGGLEAMADEDILNVMEAIGERMGYSEFTQKRKEGAYRVSRFLGLGPEKSLRGIGFDKEGLDFVRMGLENPEALAKTFEQSAGAESGRYVGDQLLDLLKSNVTLLEKIANNTGGSDKSPKTIDVNTQGE